MGDTDSLHAEFRAITKKQKYYNKIIIILSVPWYMGDTDSLHC